MCSLFYSMGFSPIVPLKDKDTGQYEKLWANHTHSCNAPLLANTQERVRWVL